MASDHPDYQLGIAAQRDMFRLAKRDYGLSPQRLHLLSKIPQPTIQAWASGAAMPVWAFWSLAKHIPDELTSMLGDHAEKHVGTNSPSEADLDALGCEAAGFTAEYCEAKRDGKVTPIERANLADRARRIGAKARAVAA